MREGNVIVEKSFQFSLKIIALVSQLKQRKVEQVLLNQLLKSGTSIGANIEEAIGGSSKKDFIYKLEIAYRESRETNYWLRLFKEGGLSEKESTLLLLNDCDEIQKILSAILTSSKSGTTL